MKKIALDLDGVVFDSENFYRVLTEIYDVQVMHKDSLMDNNKRTFQKRYLWEKEHYDIFYQKYAPIVLKNANLMTGIEEVIPLLKDNFEFFILSARSDSEITLAKSGLNKIGLNDIKVFNNEHHKIDRLVSLGIDYIIDDDEDICKNAAEQHIHALYFKNAAGEKILENSYLKIVNNWGEIYKYLMLEGMKNEN